MAEVEGVTKFQLEFTHAPAPAAAQIAALNVWRTRFVPLGLIGQDPDRYGGIGFGNLSRRLAPGSMEFVVTGTQTGAFATLDGCHYCVVTECDPLRNRLRAHGPIAPSSESLTHGQLYALDAGIQFVFHLHAPAIWRHAAALGIAGTARHAEYGTPQMVNEVERLFRETDVRRKHLFAMGGHEDGVVSFGASAEEAGETILDALARAARLSA